MVDFIRWTLNGRIYEEVFIWTTYMDDFSWTTLQGRFYMDQL